MKGIARASTLLLLAGGLVVWPSGAAADTTVLPTSLTFEAHPVGTASASQQVVLTQDCMGTDSTFCAFPGSVEFDPSISVSGPFSQTNNCPATLTATLVMTASCTINVTFRPTAAGAASGVLATGTGGPTAALAGTGTAVANKKKCKKKKKRAAAAAKKKCKKKK